MSNQNPISRRELLTARAALGFSLAGSERIIRLMPNTTDRPKLAVILTSYGPTSHGLCYCTKLLEGKQFDDHFEEPHCQVVAMHLMEKLRNDIGVDTVKKHNVPLYQSVAAALCRGGDELAVDGGVIIGEQGRFPLNEKGQQLYPRRELFDQVIGVFRPSCPVVA